jgi:hypothetical protein
LLNPEKVVNIEELVNSVEVPPEITGHERVKEAEKKLLSIRKPLEEYKDELNLEISRVDGTLMGIEVQIERLQSELLSSISEEFKSSLYAEVSHNISRGQFDRIYKKVVSDGEAKEDVIRNKFFELYDLFFE